MSIFGSLKFAIPPDYFGDEFGVPVMPPRIINKTDTLEKSNKTAELKTHDPKKGDTNNNTSKTGSNKPQQPVSPAFAPFLDGLHIFETHVL
ncbi:conserved hypothetical protein [Ricinus communis]|uniref:Uncharacterized protein n=1 Tax=Ricinus communis TaxID=3988 RepID=B9RR94_RICCO|nr:conserved hypothetical protein [Ricinus communis]